MFMLVLLIPATVIAAVGYIVLYFAGRSDGGMKSLGRVLGGWAMVLGAAIALAGVTAPLFGGRPFGLGPTREQRVERFMEMRRQMMQNGMMRDGMMRDGMMRDGMMRDGMMRDGMMQDGMMRPPTPPAPPAGVQPPAPAN
jgi:hypothetical protein